MWLEEKKNSRHGPPLEAGWVFTNKEEETLDLRLLAAYLTRRRAGRIPELRSRLWVLPCFRAFLTRTPLMRK